CGGGRGAGPAVGPAGAGDRGEPVRAAPGAPADHERPGRHHPARPGDRAGPGVAGQAGRPGGVGARRGRPVLQPRLAPGPGPAQHAAGLGGDRPRRAGADRAPGRAHPRRPPGHVGRVAQGQPGRLADRERRGPAAPPALGGAPAGPAGALRSRGARQVPDRGGAARRRPRRDPPEGGAMTAKRTFRVWRGGGDGALADYEVEVNEGEVVLDVLHRLQATQAPDLAVRWNCKAGKCGSCSMEINGRPRLSCMTRMSVFEPEETVTVTPMRTFPVIRDLVCDVSYNYAKAREIPSFTPPADAGPEGYRMAQEDVQRSQEFRKCIECFLCNNVCHVIRDHEEN